jgi:hypothetical protein
MSRVTHRVASTARGIAESIAYFKRPQKSIKKKPSFERCLVSSLDIVLLAYNCKFSTD